MKNVLFICRQFPPQNAIASYRSGCFVKYLPKFGWNPIVVCNDWKSEYGSYDPDFVPNLSPDLDISRVPVEPLTNLSFRRRWSDRLAMLIGPQYYPWDWRREASKRLHIIQARIRIDAIVASSPSLVCWQLADQYSREHQIGWVADLRDSYNHQTYLARSLYRRVAGRAESSLIRRATRSVVVTEHMASFARTIRGGECTVIENGFDPDLFVNSEQVRLDKLVIAYTGNIYPPHIDPKMFLEGVRDAIAANPALGRALELQFIGVTIQQLRTCAGDWIDRLPIVASGRISHTECIRRQRQSSVLLQLCHPTSSGIITGKIFDYLAARRPILAVPNDQDVVQALLCETGSGSIAGSVGEVTNRLLALFAEWKSTGTVAYSGSPHIVQRYSRLLQTERLACVLNSM